MVGQKQRHQLSLKYHNLSQEFYSKSTSTILHHNEDPGFFMHFQILAQKDIRRNLLPGFVTKKVLRGNCYKSVSSSIVIRNRRVQFCLSLSNNCTLRNFKKIFCFHNSTILINIIKVAMSVMIGISNLSSTGIVQQVFPVCFVKTFKRFYDKLYKVVTFYLWLCDSIILQSCFDDYLLLHYKLVEIFQTLSLAGQRLLVPT